MGRLLKIVIGVVVVVVIGIVAYTLLSDDDDEPKSAGTNTTKSADKDSDADKDSGSSSDSDSGPALTTIIVKRSSGKNAAAQAGALIKNPDEIWIRVSAAPKQETRVTWSLACGGGTASQDNYVVTPPHLRQLKVPAKAKTCAASVAAQLAKPGTTGRVKVALLKNR
jgi:hypothetical protein